MTTNLDYKKDTEESNVALLIGGLSDGDGIKRRRIRKELEKLGSKVTPQLIEALLHGDDRTRWEAAKTFIYLKDPEAADALTDALMDESFEIQWLAAEALIELGADAVKPLLLKLISHHESTFLRQGAHHVLDCLLRNRIIPPEIRNVVNELEDVAPMEPVLLAAREALKVMQHRDMSRPIDQVGESESEGGSHDA
jgi:hypothetical protein